MKFTETLNAYKFENKHFSFSLDKKNGNVLEFINLYTKEKVNASAEPYEFIHLRDFDDNKILPTALEAENGNVKITFENGLFVNLAFEIFDDFMTFEINSDLDASVRAIKFANLATNLSNDTYLLNGMGMSAWTKPSAWGYRAPAESISAEAFTHLGHGVKGAKLGVVFSKKEDAIEILKKVADAIDPKVGLTSKAGGPYAKEWAGNFGDYALVTNIAPDKLDESLKLAVEFNIDQYDVHQSAGNTFCQGNYEFAHTESGTATEYRDTLGKKIRDAGLITALHNYAYYISPRANSILSVPKWQKQLQVTEEFTLAEDIDGEALELPTLEDASGFDTSYNFLHRNMSYVLIDEEIIHIGKATSSSLAECTRGACGTRAVPHKKGSVLKHLDGIFGDFNPVLGSELFYYIADLTAKAYNEGGFDMLYFDAIDGIHNHIDDQRDCWYYHQMFIHRVLSQCERTPLVETSSGCPQEWNFRGRCGAWDYANFSIKKHITNHAIANIKDIESNLTATLGWFCFFTDENIWGNMKNTTFKTLFHDDMDFLGKYALAYDMSIVFHPLAVDSINNNPFHHANLTYYTERYTKLRKAHYFSPETLERLKDHKSEWRVIPDGDEFKLQQMHYCKANLGNAYKLSDFSYNGENPFKEQMPFVRVESRYSTLFEEPVTLATYDETKPVGEKKVVQDISTPDIDTRMAMSIKVKGTGRDGDAALISIAGGVRGEKGGRSDHFIDLNFEGWRDFILLDFDNAEYDTEKYVFDGISTTYSSYDTYRFCPNHFTFKTVALRLTGETAENAVFGDLISYPQAPAPIKNPTVKVGDTTFTFNCALHGGDYVEYDPETDKAILYHNAEQTKEEVPFTGKLTVPTGSFTAEYTAEKESEAPLRARVSLGFTGDTIR